MLTLVCCIVCGIHPYASLVFPEACTHQCCKVLHLMDVKRVQGQIEIVPINLSFPAATHTGYMVLCSSLDFIGPDHAYCEVSNAYEGCNIMMMMCIISLSCA